MYELYLRHKQGAGVNDVYKVSQTTEEWTLEKTVTKLIHNESRHILKTAQIILCTQGQSQDCSNTE